MSDNDALVEQLAALVARVSEGSVPQEAALATGVTLAELGLSSLRFLALIDTIENEYGIFIDFESAAAELRTLHGIAHHMREQGLTTVG
jgi:acyl carrier protein